MNQPHSPQVSCMKSLRELHAELARLDDLISEARERELSQVMDRILATMQVYKITLAELDRHKRARRNGRRPGSRRILTTKTSPIDQR